jgi:pSer/pThr/pTyr-binding forkhead associated (FHA) protein
MLQFNLLSGNRAGKVWVADAYPVQIGRAGGAALRLEDAGVWDKHAEVNFDASEGFILTGHQGAITSVNGTPVQQVRLRNGDIIELGSVKLQCWLAEVKRRDSSVRERLLWAGLIALTVAQLVLIVCLR